MQIKIKKLRDDAVLPTKATEGAIGYDLYVPADICIERKRQVIPLGFALELPKGIEAKIEPRSGFASKGIEGFELVKDRPKLYCRIDAAGRFDADVIVGKIDPDYRGECGVIIRYNNPDIPFLIKAGTRIAQMTFYYTECHAEFNVVEELTETERGAGGFGHTGSGELIAYKLPKETEQ